MATALNSWKEIAVYLSRGVRTVQRWEAENHLPVHRIGSGPKSPVFAYQEELQVWLQQFTIMRAGDTAVLVPVPSRGNIPTPELQRHRKLWTETQRLLEIQKIRFAALLNTVSQIEKNTRSSRGRVSRDNAELHCPDSSGSEVENAYRDRQRQSPPPVSALDTRPRFWN